MQHTTLEIFSDQIRECVQQDLDSVGFSLGLCFHGRFHYAHIAEPCGLDRSRL